MQPWLCLGMVSLQNHARFWEGIQLITISHIFSIYYQQQTPKHKHLKLSISSSILEQNPRAARVGIF